MKTNWLEKKKDFIEMKKIKKDLKFDPLYLHNIKDLLFLTNRLIFLNSVIIKLN